MTIQFVWFVTHDSAVKCSQGLCLLSYVLSYKYSLKFELYGTILNIFIYNIQINIFVRHYNQRNVHHPFWTFTFENNTQEQMNQLKFSVVYAAWRKASVFIVWATLLSGWSLFEYKQRMDLFLLQPPDQLWGSTQPPLWWVSWTLFFGVKQVGPWDNYWPPPIAKF